MRPKASHIWAIKKWLKLDDFDAGRHCPFAGTVTGARVCAMIFPEIKPRVDYPDLEEMCGFCCPCGLLGYEVVRERAQKFVDGY